MKNEAQATPKLSAASKMPCKSWSLPAWITCPGARKDNGEAVDACSHCFALQGRYTFGAVKAVRDHNMEDWKRSDWVPAMVRSIGKSKFFRWFDSGDIYTAELAKKIIEVVSMTPNCKHWIPTRAYKDYNILPYLQELDAMDNCVVRYSSDSVEGETLSFAEHNSSILQSADDFIPGIGKVLCRSYTRNGKCGDCRACWSKKIVTVFYPIHGRKVKTFPELANEMEV